MRVYDILQICNLYQPHCVHFPAAYLVEMKWFAFIRGGSAMLLYKAPKCPGVELVMGMELDKQVTLSFCHLSIAHH